MAERPYPLFNMFRITACNIGNNMSDPAMGMLVWITSMRYLLLIVTINPIPESHYHHGISDTYLEETQTLAPAFLKEVK